MSKKRFQFMLQHKVSLVLLGVISILGMTIYGVLNTVVAPTFDALEREEANSNLARAQKVIGAELSSLAWLSADWSYWDDTYEYVTGQNANFQRSNLAASTLNDLQLNLMLFFDADGDLAWGKLLQGEDDVELSATAFFGDSSPVPTKPGQFPAGVDLISGIVRSGAGPMVAVSRPILRTDGSGPAAGAVVLGRFLDGERLASMREVTEVNFTWRDVADFPPADADGGNLGRLASGEVLTEQTDTVISMSRMLFDIQGEPVLALSASTPRRISALADRTLGIAMISLGFASIVVVWVIWILMNMAIVKPLETLRAHIRELRESGDLGRKIAIDRGDEIGVLAAKFNELTGELDDARKLLLEQSFKAGKADTASEVLHNIRNAMTPVINGVDRLGMILNSERGLKVAQATGQLADPGCEAERKEKLLAYLRSAFEHIENAHAEGKRDLRAVSGQARQVEAILADQEKHAKACAIAEDLTLDEVVDEAVSVLPKRKVPKINLSVADDVSHFKVRGHRVGLLQVLGNLILNAYEAIQRTGAERGDICLFANAESVSGKPMVRLTVRDSGCGFPKDKRHKLFQRGFSSKRGNLSGLGLHWCANAVAGMGGRMSAESAGEGLGSEFHVLLPHAGGA